MQDKSIASQVANVLQRTLGVLLLAIVASLLLVSPALASDSSWMFDDDDPGRPYGEAYEYRQGNLSWQCIEYLGNDSAYEAAIFGVRHVSDGSFDALPIPETVSYNGRTCKVVGIISEGEAYGMDIIDAPFSVSFSRDDLLAVSIPRTVRFIGVGAFNEFRSLATVTFEGNSELQSIESGAFANCTSLEQFSNTGKVAIPSSVTSVASRAFINCPSIKDIVFPQGADVSESVIYGECDSLRTIENSPASIELGNHVSHITSITYAPGVTTVYGLRGNNGARATGLKTVGLPEGVTRIDDFAFDGCSALTSINLPSSLTEIGIDAFNGCSSLTGIRELPASVTSVGRGAFRDCKNLAMKVNHPGDSLWDQYVNSGITSITLSGDIVWMNATYFSGCKNLTSIAVTPGSGPFTSIDGVLFDKTTDGEPFLVKYPAAKGGSSYTIPAQAVGVGGLAFEDCRNLKEVHVPVTVKYVEKSNVASGATPWMEDGWYDPFARTVSKPTVYYVENSYADSEINGVLISCPAKTELGPSLNITYKLNGGSNNAGNPATMRGGQSLTLKAPARSGYTFSGWYVDGEKLEDNVLTPYEQQLIDGVTVEAKWAKKGSVATQQMYRLYNPNSGEHFYTAKAKERDALKGIGWVYEGVGWTAPMESKTPVYRLYNEIAGDHHYTMKEGEKDALLKIPGWKYEGIGWYSDDAKGTPLYRQYNPNAFACNHNYTTNKKENDALVSKFGWKAEGVGWYGVK